MNTSAVLVVVIAIAVVCLIVAVGIGVWWVLTSRARREHEESLRSLGVPAPQTGAEPFGLGDTAFGAHDTVQITPLSGVEFDYERLAAEPFQAPPGVPLGQPVSSEPFSWTAAVSDPGPLPVPAVGSLPAAGSPEEWDLPPAAAPRLEWSAPPIDAMLADWDPQPAAVEPEPPAAPGPRRAAAPIPPAHEPSILPVPEHSAPAPAQPETAAAIHTALPDDDLDRTTVVRRGEPWAWNLVLPDGTSLPLGVDNVIGRRPETDANAQALVIADPTRTLSKTHARLRFDGVGWVIEDLGSTNGVVLLHDDGREQELEPRQPVFATQWMLLGTLEIMLREGS